jgi:hypothetical protein
VPDIPSGLMNDDANNRLATDAYDNNGNTINNGGIGNIYDFENHLVQHGNVQIVYNRDGNRNIWNPKLIQNVLTMLIITTIVVGVLIGLTGRQPVPI